MDILELFKGAPEEIRRAAAVHHENLKRLHKAEVQEGLWKDELDCARLAFDSSDREFKYLMNRYDGGTLRPDPKMEL